MLRLLEARGVRNLEPVQMEPAPQFNLFTGPNGSGKTSLLEAVSVLASGRSFRSAQLDRVINYELSDLVVSGQVSEDRATRRIGFAKVRSGATTARIDGQSVRSASDYAAVLPLQALVPDLGALVTGEPALRRRFLDWGVFHGRPAFRKVAAVYRRNLSQRNAALRSGNGAGARVFDQGMVGAAEELDRLRSTWFDDFQASFEEIGSRFSLLEDLGLDYRAGWDRDQGLASVLDASFASDLQAGFTRSGPHRAEIAIRSGGKRASERLSRGQSKVVAFCMLAAQAQMLRRDSGRRPVVLVDDLVSELDAEHRLRALETLIDLGVQVFVADVAGELLLDELSRISSVETKWFHVEHGQIVPRLT